MEKRRLHEIIKSKILSFFAQILFLINSYSLSFRNVNHPDTENGNFIFACWHAHQCALYSIKNRENMYSMISKSTDGDIIANAGGRVGIQSVRGSSKRGGADATRKLLDKLNEGFSAALAVDGPRGPKFKAKKGVVELAKLSGVPIIPMAWFGKSPFLIKFNTWDEFLFPFIFGTIVTLYGEPIYVPKDADKEVLEQYRNKLDEEMIRLNRELRENYDKYLKISVRNTEKSKSVVSWF